MKILVVEDDRGTRKIVIAMLRKIGLTDVIEADRGDQAWQILKFTPVDMVLTDWTLPGMDGLELVSQLRHSKDHRDLPILVFSSRADREDIVTALKAGIDTYLSKPFNAHQLGDKIKSIAGKYWQRQANQVFRGRDALQKNDEYPLLIFGEPVGDAWGDEFVPQAERRS